MTATSAGGSRCLTAKGLDISLAALQRQDPYINNIVDVASQVALYTYNNRSNEWEKTQVEGTLFIYTRLASPRHGFTIMNRLSMENLTEPITKDLDFQLQDPFLLYRNARLVIHGIWFYDKEDCQRIAQRMKILTQQEQVLAQSQGGWLSPGGGGAGGKGEGKPVDIIQMLTKAHTAYDKEKSTLEPREIGGSSVLYGNPNLIKPIPVKPNTQDSEGSEPKSLSLATLFGSQHAHTPKSVNPIPPSAPSGTPPSAGKLSRPPVARTLTYEASLGSKGGIVSLPGCPDPGVRAVIGGQAMRQGGGSVAPGVLQIPTAAQPNQQQHCPAIQKLMQGQRGGVGAVLQTVSESPENRLCDNGVPLEHHLHHHHLYHHHPQHHQLLQLHQQQQQQQQQQQLQQQQLQQQQQQQQLQQHLQPDPIKRLFQTQPPPHAPPSAAFSSAPPCCPIPPPLQQTTLLPTQPMMADLAQCSHLPAPQSQQLFFSLSKPQLQAELNSQSASTAQGAGVPAQMPGVVSPHELLQKLQLVQQEQSLASHDPPRPGLAPRFLGPAQSQGGGQNAATAAQKAALQFQVISPQRIPATVAPNMLLSPSVFVQVNPGGGLSGQDGCPAPSPSSRVLSRSQFQATLLHLIQSDGSFVDTIYEAYVGRSAKDPGSKY